MFSVTPVAPRLWWHDIYFRNFPLNFKVSSGSNLCKGTLTFILLPLLNFNPAGETSNAIHHFLSPFSQNV